MDCLPPTEASNPSTSDLDRLGTLSLLHRINDEDRRAAWAVERDIGSIAAAVDAVYDRLKSGGSLHYFGAGTSGRLGVLDAAEIPPTFSTDPATVVGHIAGGVDALSRAVEACEDDGDAGRREAVAAGLSARDAAVGISASGRAAYVLGALAAAKSAGALAVCITSDPDSPLAEIADIPIVLRTGPEVIAGSTRMKAGAAQKMTLTMLSTAVMVKLGKVHGNLMVDLTATNAKLRSRAVRVACSVTGASADEARAALARSDYQVKTAIVMLATRCSAEDAKAMLAASGGSLRRALEGRAATER
jgi:N-acetylmuramic acid 6-phosphate etherase